MADHSDLSNLARRRRAGKFVDYKTEVEDGMVVLDAVHRIQATAGQRYGGALELQGGQVRIVLGGDQRQAAADVHDADEPYRI